MTDLFSNYSVSTSKAISRPPLKIESYRSFYMILGMLKGLTGNLNFCFDCCCVSNKNDIISSAFINILFCSSQIVKTVLGVI